MEEYGILLNDCIYNMIIRGYFVRNDFIKVKEFIDIMISKGFFVDVDIVFLLVELMLSD